MTKSAKSPNQVSARAGCLKMLLWACIGLGALSVVSAILSPRPAAQPGAAATSPPAQAAPQKATDAPPANAKAVPVATEKAQVLSVTKPPTLVINTQPPATSAPAVTDTPEPTATPNDPVQSIAQKQCQARLRTAEIADGTYLVTCKLAENFTQSWMVGGAVDDVIGIAKDGFVLPEVKAVTVQLIGDFKDEYGNPKELPAFTFRLPRQLYAKINWANTSPNDLARLMDKKRDGASVGVAPAWRDSWREYIQ